MRHTKLHDLKPYVHKTIQALEKGHVSHTQKITLVINFQLLIKKLPAGHKELSFRTL